ncbi:MAG: peptide chain release factor N(5)-glutamine methyltransferase [Planctomycetota bacterium]|jgi:release factor glutamine methyltransferase
MNSGIDAGNGAWTVQRLMAWTTDWFQQHQLDEPRLACEVLLAHATGWKRIELYARFDHTISDEARTRFRNLVQRAAKHEPIAYLVGEKEFYSLAFHVSPAVLIPRAETELLVEITVDLLKNSAHENGNILDLGTGSGCIAISLLNQLPDATATATDISKDALEIAEQNAKRHGVDSRLKLVCADQLEGIGDGIAEAVRFDAIVSNPPYIPAADVSTLDENVRDYEPRHALTDEADGLSFYQALADKAGALLADDGFVAVEVADNCADMVREVFEGNPAQPASAWHCAGSWCDRTTGQERVIMFKQN